ncbi:MAG: COQ9 family protein [Alphaproteobacteria bacterium]|nr:COQ9 family protein [Alphaproteobacteria bacterium]MDE2162901.1 COQ9 family protein [Alphaproteobacteria bacterium]MDE2267034.1 COQ9 family protein [Alphaproteobacteria bacterium]MDE2500323.1 COQ9 family protein [Alphaproteobacteria bacterium]
MTTRKPKPGTKSDAALKSAIIEAALPHIAFDGLTDKLMDRAAKEAGAGKDDLLRLFPNGALGLLEAYSDSVDAEMERRLAKLKLTAMPIRKRIATAVKTRLAILKPHKEAVRRGIAHLSLPQNVPLGAKLVYRTVDAMWRAAGDVSTDFNFYTKRGILAGVYSATLMRWLTDVSEDEGATDAFLAARIENVMQFEKLKAQVKARAKKLPALADVLSGFSGRRS